MRWLFHPLLLLLANSSEGNLAKQVEYLKAENAMLRKRLPKWLQTTAEERALLIKLGKAVGPGIRFLITIVQYNCYRRWVTKANGTYGQNSGKYKKAGRPRTPEQISGLAERLARLAADDPELAADLGAWHATTIATVAVTGAGDVTNTVTGTVYGNVVQARDVSGPITFQ